MDPSLLYSVVSSIITTPLSFMYIYLLSYKWRFQLSTMIKIASLYLSTLACINLYIFYLFGISPSTKFSVAIINIACSIFYILLFAKHIAMQLLFTYTNTCIFIFVSDTLTGILFPTAGFVHIAAKIVIYGFIGLVIYYFFRPSFLETIGQLRKTKKWYMLFPAVLCLLLFIIIQGQGPLYSLPEFRPIILILCFCAVCVYISYFMAFSAIRRQSSDELDKNVLQAQIIALEKNLSLLTQTNEHMAMFRHDLRHFYQIQTGCLESGNIDGAQNALQSVFHNLENICREYIINPYTGHTALDSVISYYASIAEEEDIQFTVQVNINQIPDNITEFTVILSNALENAHHACQKMAPGVCRMIRLRGTEDAGKLYLEISNTFDGNISFYPSGLPICQTEGHGYGTKSIAYFVNRSNGELSFFTRDGWFFVHIVLTCSK